MSFEYVSRSSLGEFCPLCSSISVNFATSLESRRRNCVNKIGNAFLQIVGIEIRLLNDQLSEIEPLDLIGKDVSQARARKFR